MGALMEPSGLIVGIGEVLWDLLPAGPRLGGAPFNFAYHCRQLGHPATIVSRVGNDTLGDDLLAEVEKLGISTAFIQTDVHHPTGTVEVCVNAYGQATYNILAPVAYDFLEWYPELAPLARSARAICFGTLASRNAVSQEVIDSFLYCSGIDTIRILDLNLRAPFYEARRIDAMLDQCQWLKLNDDEWSLLSQMLDLPADPSLTGLQQLRESLDLELVALTRGALGAWVVTKTEAVTVPALAVSIVDTVGSGDAFTAGLLTRILEGASLADATRFASVLAGKVASVSGATPRIDRAEVDELC